MGLLWEAVALLQNSTDILVSQSWVIQSTPNLAPHQRTVVLEVCLVANNEIIKKINVRRVCLSFLCVVSPLILSKLRTLM